MTIRRHASVRSRVLGGAPDVIGGMKYGGTRYKYDHGLFIDEVWGHARTPTFYVAQAGLGRIGEAHSLKTAERIAARRALAELREKRPRHARSR